MFPFRMPVHSKRKSTAAVQTGKAQMSLFLHTVLLEPLLLAHTMQGHRTKVNSLTSSPTR